MKLLRYWTTAISFDLKRDETVQKENKKKNLSPKNYLFYTEESVFMSVANYVCMSVSSSVCLTVCLYVCPWADILGVDLSVCLSVCQFGIVIWNSGVTRLLGKA